MKTSEKLEIQKHQVSDKVTYKVTYFKEPKAKIRTETYLACLGCSVHPGDRGNDA
jgi:hypothetical protein